MAAALPPRVASPDVGTLERAVISTVAYADVFDYPLRALEVQRYLHGVRATGDATAAALAGSAAGGALSQRDGFYTLRGRESLVDVRRARAAHAARLWPTAVRYAHVIAAVPFVRMVAVTGSLAWDNIEQGGDIDYLVVTDPDHLWTCRWLLGALRRVAHVGGTPLCPNYVVSTRALLVTERDLYGAYELARMTPVVGRSIYRRMRRTNTWAARYLPNAIEAPRAPHIPAPSGRPGGSRVLLGLTRLGERALRSRIGAAFERWEMNYRIRKWCRPGAPRGEAAYGLDWCKALTQGHRQDTLNAFAERVRRLGGGEGWGGVG